ncbi:MAG: aldose 1-epimerase family protein, partial [Oscillospiraceae bacterium]
MDTFLENNFLRVRIASLGAELTSIIKKDDNSELLWNADPSVWNRHAPILFPYCGKLKNGQFTHNGVEYKGGGHGFARDLEFALVKQDETCVSFELAANAITMEKFPFVFRLTITYTLSGTTLSQDVEVANEGDWDMPFSVGFHPGFVCPFDDKHTVEDYELRFSKQETPIEIKTGAADGLVTGEEREFFADKNTIALTNTLFSNDSICLKNLCSDTITLVEKDTGRSISVGIKGFPYVLLWSAIGDLKFVCIEPWHGLPDSFDATGEWSDKAATVTISECDKWNTCL